MMVHSSDASTYAGYRSLAMDAVARFTGKLAHAAENLGRKECP